jgi:hypothetical protein
MANKARQLELCLPTWGGRRKNAGRKRNGDRPAVSHRPRDLLRPEWAVHVTLRVLHHVWNLRSRRCFSAIESAFAAPRERFGMRIVHFSVQGNHIHLNYVLRNHAHHAEQWGETVGDDEVDLFSSAPRIGAAAPPVSAPQTWLLNAGWKRAA